MLSPSRSRALGLLLALAWTVSPGCTQVLNAGLAMAGPEVGPLALEMLRHTSAQATTGQGCGLNVFAYVRLGLGDTAAPMSVLR